MKSKLSTALTKVAACWLDRQYPLRQEALESAAPEFCLSAASFELALDWIFNQWTENKITELIATNPYKKNSYAAQILASNTPAMIAQGFLQGAILQIPQVIKIPHEQPRFAQLLQQAFLENAVPGADLFELNAGADKLAQFYSRLTEADVVFAYGHDETLAALKKYLAPDAIFVEHGHAESAAIIFKEAATLSSLEKLAYDMLSYDQRGCLSPRVTFVEQGGELSPAACAKIFAEEVLPAIAERLPRGGLFAGEAAEILHQRNVYGFRGQVYAGSDWTVCYDEKLSWPLEALPRFMPFKPFASQQTLLSVLNPIKPQLISLGCAGSEPQLELLRQTISTRFSALGEMQKQLLVF